MYYTKLILFKNLRLRIAIVRSAWRQPNISKRTSTVSCDLVLKIFLNVLFMTAAPVCVLIVLEVLVADVQSI